MLYYDRTNVSKEIGPTKSNKSKECMICHYWFSNDGFKFQDSLCYGRYDLTIFCLHISNIAVIIVKDVDYRCIIHSVSKSEAISLLKKFFD